MSTKTERKVRYTTYRDKRVVITPAIATEWLDKNVSNRPVTQSYVDKFAADMRLDRWHLTGDAIKFNEYGDLIDGQHRLWACLLAQVPFETNVAYGVKDEARIVIDTGRKRSLGNYLSMSGEVNSVQLAATINLAWRYDQGHFDQGWGHVGRTQPTHEEAVHWLSANPAIRASVLVGDEVRRATKFVCPPVAASHYLWGRSDAALADTFWDGVKTGVDLRARSAELAMRNWIFKFVSDRQARPKGDIVLFYCMKALSLSAEGRSIVHVVAREQEPIAKP